MLGLAEQYFLTVVQEGSFTKASRRLFLSQSAISKQIMTLEKKLGYSLLDRNTRRLSLTSRGRLLYDALVDCGRIMENALETARLLEETAYAKLRIGVLSGWSSHRPPLSKITSFKAKYPQISVTIQQFTYRDMMQKLLDQKLDLILTVPCEVTADSSICLMEAFMANLILYISASHPLGGSDKLPRDFKKTKAYVMDKEASLYSLDSIEEVIAENNLNLKLFGMPNVDSIYTAVEQGEAVGFTLSLSRVCESPLFKTYVVGENKKMVFAWNRYNYTRSIELFLDSFMRDSKGASEFSPLSVPVGAGRNDGGL